MLLVFVFLTAPLIIATKPVSAATEDSWVSKAPMQQARANFGIAVVDEKIYAFGGDGGSTMGSGIGLPIGHTANTLSTNEVYDPATDTWTFKKPMPTARALLGVAVYKNKVYCIGGYYGNSNSSTGKTGFFNTGVARAHHKWLQVEIQWLNSR